ncbi:hypothetical protein VPH35_036769 [Triticum aestivum]
MAEEPSAKRQLGKMSNQSSNLDDVHVPGEKLEYTKMLTGVELQGKETLGAVCTSEPGEVDEMIRRLRMKGGGLFPSFIGVDVPKRLKELLKEEKLYNFFGFSIKDDKEMLKKSSLEINPKNFIDIQHNWRGPYTGIEYDSLADVASSVIHLFYDNMKKKIDRKEDHKLWGTSPLPEKLIEYASIDAYATYQTWKKIDNIKTGLESSKQEEADPYYHCHYAG